MTTATTSALLETSIVTGVAAPAVLFLFFSAWGLTGAAPNERAFGTAIRATMAISVAALLTAAWVFLSSGLRTFQVPLGTWIATPNSHLDLMLLCDRLSLPLAIFSSLLSGAVGVFAIRYLSREPGFTRFFILFGLFWLGMLLVVLAGNVELLYGGWEFVGLSSALLIAYFHERPAPCSNGIRAYVVYKLCDLGLIAAALLCHHWLGGGDFDLLFGTASWPAGDSALTGGQALTIGLLFAFSAAGKSAQVPFSGWLPRAMEGPTPSSAIFYGALSVHAGAFLLLRIGPLLQQAPLAALAVVCMGLATATYATLVGRVQTDIKSALAYSALTQVSIIIVEIGCGLRYLALLHLIGHAAVRSLQILRSPSLLHDRHELEDAAGGGDAAVNTELLRPAWFHVERLVPESLRRYTFRLALERGNWDQILEVYIIAPFLAVFRAADRLERSVSAKLFGGRKSS